jgi:putative transposase
MTLPRIITPGSTWMLTRRITQRQFLIKPSPLTNLIFAFCLGLAAMMTGVILHAFCVMSNHWHAVVTDPYGRLPEFTEWVHKFVAKCMNVKLGRWENLWSSEHCSDVLLTDREDILNKILYVDANPVSAELVQSASQWPGLISRPSDYTAGPVMIDRPDIFFRENGTVPEKVPLKLVVPPAFADMSPQEFRQLVERELHTKENNVKRRLSRENRRVMGVKMILAQSVYDSPRTYAQHRGLNPRLAAVDPWRRLETIRRLKSFIIAYREAMEQFKAGVHDVLFPPGTYWMKRFGGAACGPPG